MLKLEKKSDILNIVHRMEIGENLSKDEKLGVVSHSPLLNIDYFDFVNDIPVDYMHNICLGVVKRMLELCFNIGKQRIRITNRTLRPPNLFNKKIKSVKVPSDFSRRCRELDFSVLKAQEFRNIALFFFPLILDSLPRNCTERKLWLSLSFILRACILPSDESQILNENFISTLASNFYVTYEKLFGSSNCTYNTYMFSAHIMKMKGSGNLTDTSCFVFENFYAELRNCYVPGTPSTLKQMFEKSFLRRTLSRHTCSPPISVSNNDTNLTCDSLIYTHSESQYKFYKINDICDDYLTCSTLGKSLFQFEQEKQLNWNTVGVFQCGAVASDTVYVTRNNVKGKVIRVGKILLTCPNNVLIEK